MERSLTKRGIILLLIIFLFYSCDRRITGCYSFKEYGDQYAMVLNDDSTFIYDLLYWEEGAGKYSFGRFSVNNNKLILNSSYSNIDDSLEVISSKMNYQGFIRLTFSYLRQSINETSLVTLRIGNSKSLIWPFYNSIILFDSTVDTSVLKNYKVRFDAFKVKSVSLLSSLEIIASDREKYMITIDTTADDYYISLISSYCDSLRQYRFFENEEWEIHRRRIFDPKRGDVFRKTKKCPDYYRPKYKIK